MIPPFVTICFSRETDAHTGSKMMALVNLTTVKGVAQHSVEIFAFK